ncbi:MAG: DUF222 domain-containing protein [Acidimicrobiia bacterium]|nr:DUF222 domain-containing protein [Acidimicrobiia bacterium]
MRSDTVKPNTIFIPMIGDPERVSVDELDEHLMLLEAARDRLEVEWTESLGAFERRDGAEIFDYPSTVAYLKDRLGMAAGRANRYLHNARTAFRFRATFESWRHRLIGSDQIAVLFRTAEKRPDEYADDELGLLEICEDESPAETRKVLDYWLTTVPSAPDADQQLRRRRLDYRRNDEGMVEGSFALTPLAGEAFITSIDSLLSPPDPDDERTPTQRRHDALEDLAHHHLARGETIRGGEKPHISLHVDLDALKGIPGGLHESDSRYVLDVDDVRRVACQSYGVRSQVGDHRCGPQDPGRVRRNAQGGGCSRPPLRLSGVRP